MPRNFGAKCQPYAKVRLGPLRHAAGDAPHFLRGERCRARRRRYDPATHFCADIHHRRDVLNQPLVVSCGGGILDLGLAPIVTTASKYNFPIEIAVAALASEDDQPIGLPSQVPYVFASGDSHPFQVLIARLLVAAEAGKCYRGRAVRRNKAALAAARVRIFPAPIRRNHREHFQRKTPGQPTPVPLDHNLGHGCPVFRRRRVAVVPSPCISEVGYEHQRDGNADAGTYSCG